jgi:mono/diheme cytochrome c family protein
LDIGKGAVMPQGGWLAAALALGMLAMSSPGAAQNYGDASRGRGLAMRVCIACHGVRTQEVSINPRAPAFDSIAETWGMSETALSVALRVPHRDMPNIMLEAQERADVIAYIMSLRNK